MLSRLFPGPIRLIPVAMVAALIVAACGGGDPTPTPRPTATSPPPTATTAATPTPEPGVPQPIVNEGGRRGGIFQLRGPYNFNIWDSYNARAGAEWPWLAPMFNGLISPDPYNERVLVGELADTWEVSANGTVYTFKLRAGVTWHDGVPVTADDIVYNLDRAKNPPAELAPLWVLNNNVRDLVSVEAVDTLTVRVTLEGVSASFLDRISVRQFAMYPAHIPVSDQLDAFKANPVGSGPFKMANFEPDSAIEYVRNENYFKPGLPYLDGVTYNIIPFANDEAASAAFRTGKFMAVVWDATTVQPIRQNLVNDLGFVLHTATAGRSGLHFNNRPPWDDPRIRQAISMGLNRQLILDAWLEGEGSTLAAPVLPVDQGGKWGFSASQMAQRPGFPTASAADLTAAKALIAQTGIDPGSITIDYVAVAAFSRAGAPESIASALNELGFEVEISILGRAELAAKVDAGDFDIQHQVHSISIDDPLDRGGMESLIEGHANNEGKWAVAEFEQLSGEQDRLLDPAERGRVIDRMQEIYLDHASSIPMLYRNYVAGAASFVKNYPPFLYTFSPFYRWEQIWLDQ